MICVRRLLCLMYIFFSTCSYVLTLNETIQRLLSNHPLFSPRIFVRKTGYVFFCWRSSSWQVIDITVAASDWLDDASWMRRCQPLKMLNILVAIHQSFWIELNHFFSSVFSCFFKDIAGQWFLALVNFKHYFVHVSVHSIFIMQRSRTRKILLLCEDLLTVSTLIPIRSPHETDLTRYLHTSSVIITY